MKADPNVYSALARLANFVSQSDCILVLLLTPVLASNLLILAHGRQNIDKLFLVNSYLPGCCIAQIGLQAGASICSVHTGLETGYGCAYNCFQNVDNNCYKWMMTFSLPNAINISGHPLATVWSGHFVVAVLMWKHVRTCVRLATPPIVDLICHHALRERRWEWVCVWNLWVEDFWKQG